jgi:hypothetical protein
MEEMAAAAAGLGHEYLVITDHSPRLSVANGLSAERLRGQLALIGRLNEELTPLRLLSGIEVDVLDDGSLDQDEHLLAWTSRKRGLPYEMTLRALTRSSGRGGRRALGPAELSS